MMASNPMIEDVPSLMRELREKQELHFNKLFIENERNQPILEGILDRLDKLERRKNFTQNDSNFDTCDINPNHGCYDALTDEIASLKAKLVDSEMQYNMLKFRNANPNCLLTPDSMINKVSRDGADSSPDNILLERKVQELEGELASAKREILTLKNPEKVERNERSRRQNYSIYDTNSMTANTGDNKYLEERSQVYGSRYSDLVDTYEDLKIRFDESFRKNSAKDDRIHELEQALEVAKRNDTNKEMFLDIKEDEIIKNEKLIQSLHKEKTDLQERLSQHSVPEGDKNTQELCDLLRDNQSNSDRMDSYERINSDLALRVDNLSTHIQDLQTQLAKAIELRDSYYSRCGSLYSELTDLQNNRRVMERGIQEKESLIKSLQQDIREAKTSLETYQEQSRLFQSDLAEREVKLKSYLTDNDRLKFQLDESNQKLSNLHREMEKEKNMHKAQSSMTPYALGGYSTAVPPPPQPYNYPGPVSSVYPSSGYYNEPH